MARINEARLGLLAGRRDYRALREALRDVHDVDVAQFLENLPEDMQLLIFRTLYKDQAMGVFAELMPEIQQHIIKSASDSELSALVEELAVDDAVDMLDEMPAALVKRVLKNTTAETRELINHFLRYPDDSAGSIMTAEFTSLRQSMTVEDAIKRIRRIGENRETIYNCYVTDDNRHLIGVVTVRDILFAGDKEIISKLMEENVITVVTTENRETAVNLMARYGFMSLPVVDAEHRLVGIVTVDDAVDVMEEEATEDFEKMSAMSPSDKPYLKTGVGAMAKNRIFWLVFLMVSGMITGGILGHYEVIFVSVPMLVSFIPMLTNTGGNAGSQASTMVIRGIALGEIDMHSIPAVIWKELRVSIVVGIPLAAVNFVRIAALNPGSELVALTVSLTMLCTVLLANTIGGVLPLLAKVIGADPALMAAPLIATIVDAVSLVIYSSVAIYLLT